MQQDPFDFEIVDASCQYYSIKQTSHISHVDEDKNEAYNLAFRCKIANTYFFYLNTNPST